MNRIIIATLALALSGCVSYDTYTADKNSVWSELNWQMHEIRELQKDVIEIRRGYRVIPVRVTVTNAVPIDGTR